jgi:hypothetical protein
MMSRAAAIGKPLAVAALFGSQHYNRSPRPWKPLRERGDILSLDGFVICAAGVSGPGVSRPGTMAIAATNAINPAAIIARNMRSIPRKSTMGRYVP